MSNRYCWRTEHGEPCRLPCDHCEAGCPRADWEDSDLNRARTAEWEARTPKRRGRRPALSEHQKDIIRGQYYRGPFSVQNLAHMYRVSEGTILRVLNARTE